MSNSDTDVIDKVPKNWQERLKAEYLQLSVRLSLLNDFIKSAEETDDESVRQQITLLMAQAAAMSAYLCILVERARLAGIQL